MKHSSKPVMVVKCHGHCQVEAVYSAAFLEALGRSSQVRTSSRSSKKNLIISLHSEACRKQHGVFEVSDPESSLCLYETLAAALYLCTSAEKYGNIATLEFLRGLLPFSLAILKAASQSLKFRNLAINIWGALRRSSRHVVSSLYRQGGGEGLTSICGGVAVLRRWLDLYLPHSQGAR